MNHVMAFFATAALVFAGVSPAQAADNSGGSVFGLDAQNGSGQHGTVALKSKGNQTVIEIHLLGAAGTSESAQISASACSTTPAAAKFALTPLAGGISETTVDQPLSALLAGGLSVNVYATTAGVKTYLACGNL